MELATVALWASLGLLLAVLLALDLRFFPRQPTFRQAVGWSLGWFAVALLVALGVWLARHGDHAALYTTVYVIERSLSLDNVFVFLFLFAYFGVPAEQRSRLLVWGIGAALVLRAAVILGGLALIARLEFLIYVLGAVLLLLAIRMLRGSGGLDPERSRGMRILRHVVPLTDGPRGDRLFVREAGLLRATPLFLCLTAVVMADLVFAADSIPAAFAVTRDPFLIWMGNVFALLGLRALFALAERLRDRFRYFEQTVAAILAAVALKLLTEDLVRIDPFASLGVVLGLLAFGIAASLVAERRTSIRARAQAEP